MSPETLSRLAISKVVTFTSTYDHRIIQGAESGAFLARIEELLLGEHGFYEKVFADLGIPYTPYTGRVDRTPALFSATAGAERSRSRPGCSSSSTRTACAATWSPTWIPLGLDARPQPPGARPRNLRPDDLGPRPRVLDGRACRAASEMPLREIVALMRRVYCGKVGTEYRHISSPDGEGLDPPAVGALPRPVLPNGLRRKAARKADRRRDVRAIPRHALPRPAPLLDRGQRDRDRAARSARRGRGRARRRRGRHGPDPPRTSEHPRQRRRKRRRANLRRLRRDGPSGLPGRRGRRQVSPGRAHDARDGVRKASRDHRALEPLAPRGGRPGRRGHGSRQAGPAARRAGTEVEACSAGPPPRRRRVRGAGAWSRRR